MNWVQRLQGVWVAACALLGLGFGVFTPWGAIAGHLIVPALLLMLATVFMDMGRPRLRGGTVVVASLALNFVFTPLFAWALGVGLLGDNMDLRIGLCLLLVTPCTDWYLVFTALARGNTALSASLLPLNLVLQLALLPMYVTLLSGEEIGWGIFGHLLAASLIVLIIPACLAWMGRQLSVQAVSAQLMIPLLCLAVFAMFAANAEIVTENHQLLWQLLPPLLLFFLVAPLLAAALAWALGMAGPERVSLIMVTTARNSPIALGIAVVAFPERPLIALALIIGPLLELPILALLAQITSLRSRL